MTAIPIDGIVIDIGDIPQWFIAIAAAFVVYKVWISEKHTADLLEKIEQVRHETTSMRSALEMASKSEGRLEGRQEMRAESIAARETAKDVVRHDAIADAETQAKVKAADPLRPVSYPAAVGVIIAEAASPTSAKITK